MVQGEEVSVMNLISSNTSYLEITINERIEVLQSMAVDMFEI
jgi:hypothetical protein